MKIHTAVIKIMFIIKPASRTADSIISFCMALILLQGENVKNACTRQFILCTLLPSDEERGKLDFP